jgi:hypothetical protein
VPLKPDPGSVRFDGVVTVVALLGVAVAYYVLPGRVGMFVGALGLFVAVLAGSGFLFFGATMVSMALEGRRRTQFQVAVSLAAPGAVAFFLASRTDDVPLETLHTIVTPWLLVPLGIIGWVCWFSGDLLDLEHPFRGFLIATAVFAVLCWSWSMGMSIESDSNGEGSSAYLLDPEQARRARETGEYVWRFLIYVASAYLVLFLKLRLRLRHLVLK